MPPPNHAWAAASSSADKLHSRKVFSHSSTSTSAYARHLQATDAYLRYYGGSVPAPVKARSERDILEENHQFIREDDDKVDDKDEEKAIARKYYEKLFKEFAVVELAKWREKQIAMRWRTKEEVLAGKGQFSCANLSCMNCENTLDEDPDDSTGKEGKKEGLRGFELMFEYVEKNEKKNALVKVRVCSECEAKLQHIQSSGEKKTRHDRSKSKDEGRARRPRRRSRSQSLNERSRRKDGHEAENCDRDRSRSRKKRGERRRSRSPRERDKKKEGYRPRHRSRHRESP